MGVPEQLLGSGVTRRDDLSVGLETHSHSPSPRAERKTMQTSPRGSSARPSTRSYLLIGRWLVVGALLLGAAFWLYPRRGAFPQLLAAPQPTLFARAAASHLQVAAPGARGGARSGVVTERGLTPTQGLATKVGAPEAAAVSAAGQALGGVVEDALGGPISGALVTARPLEGATEIGRGVSDAEGRFELELAPGWVVLSAAADGYSRGRAEVFAPARRARLVLAPESMIQGRVVRAGSGEAVPDVGVTATSTTVGGSRIDPVTAVSDERGDFRLAGLPAGTFQLSALAQRFRGEPVSVTLTVGEISHDVLLPVQEGAVIEGLVVVDGEPCGAAVVALTGPTTLYGTANDVGAFTLPGVVRGRYAVHVDCPSALPLEDELLVGDAPLRTTWTLERGQRLTGTLTRASGDAPEGGIVTCAPALLDGVEPEGAVREVSCKTDARGEFSCAGLERRHYRCGSALHGIAQQDTTQVDFRSAVGVQRVSLLADPSADLHVSLDVEGLGDALSSSVVVFARRADGPVLQAERGAGDFWFRGIPLGAYKVYLGPAAEDPRESISASLSRDGEEVSARLRLPRLATLRGHVQDEQGNALPEVWVRATSPDPGWSLALESAPAVLSEGDGRFVLGGLVPGRHAIVAGSPVDRGFVEQRVEVTPGQELDLTLVLRLARNGNNPVPALAGVEPETTQ